jgi:IS30 family transposase
MNYQQLTTEERYQIYSLKKAGLSQTKIAAFLSRHPATISRELNRNKGARGYRPKQAQQLSDTRRRGASKNRKMTTAIVDKIVCLIRQELSPEQAAEYLRREQIVSLHHETIYQLIYADKLSGGTLYQHLRVLRKNYRKRYGSYDSRGKIKNRVCIEARPAVVDRLSRIGDWEGDTIIGLGRQSALLTMVERKTLYTVIVKLDGKRAEPLATALINRMKKEKGRIKTITFDNGHEFSDHERMAKKLGAKVYFAHSYSSWERGRNENTNGLIRQYFPKRTDLNKVTQEEIDFVMNRLNNRPRKTRDNKTPNELFKGLRVDLLAA